MKRLALGLAAVALAAGPASASPELPKPRTYPVYCGYTLVYVCGYCVEMGTVTNCTTWE